MTFTQWFDIPKGIPHHYHCVATAETTNDQKLWADASTMIPDFVGWQPEDSLFWMYQQFERVLPDTEPGTWERGEILTVLSNFDPKPTAWTFWGRQRDALDHGHWLLHPIWIKRPRKLVLSVLGFGDRHQIGNGFKVCNAHDRPEDKPFIGLDVVTR